MYVPKEALELFDAGFGTDEIVSRGITNKEGNPPAARTIRGWYLYWEILRGKKQVISNEDSPVGFVVDEPEELDADLTTAIEKAIKNNPMSLRQLSEKLDRSERTIEDAVDDLRTKGHNISKYERQVELSTVRSVQNIDQLPGAIADSMELKIAVPSDTHKGSKAEQITNLRRFIAYARERGYKKFCVPGDLTSGRNGYKGQSLEQYATTAEQQIEAFNRDVVPLPDEQWYVLGGNHDFWHITNGGTDVVWRICQQYPNMHFMGYDVGDIPLTDKAKIRMWHPTGGVPYASSYRLQKGMEGLAYEQLLNLVEQSEDQSVVLYLVGHLHIELSMQRGPILAAQVGCFEGRTNYLSRKGLYPQIGGYLFSLYLNDAGQVSKNVREFVSFPEIREDFKNYEEVLDTISDIDNVEIMYQLEEDSANY